MYDLGWGIEGGKWAECEGVEEGGRGDEKGQGRGGDRKPGAEDEKGCN